MYVNVIILITFKSAILSLMIYTEEKVSNA